ncbi:MAG: TetR/AcrR family transcriptional regulator [Ktedonobacteraceae bacterium]|nr:TetR/AcrR family transcriptional regulator [Ktedonobacteraceae bacterium]
MRQLLEEKSFQALTVHDITTRASVNRGTFYLHFSDKYALLDDYIREEFQRVLPAQFLTSPSLNRENTRLLTLTTMDYLARTYEHCRLADKPIESVLEIAVQQEIYQVLVKMLKNAQATETSFPASVEMIATVISWAIFGAGTQWRQGARDATLETMAQQVMAMLVNGLSPILSPFSA